MKASKPLAIRRSRSFSAGVAFSYCAGYDMVQNHLSSFLNLCIDKPIAIREQVIAKRYREEEICVR